MAHLFRIEWAATYPRTILSCPSLLVQAGVDALTAEQFSYELVKPIATTTN